MKVQQYPYDLQILPQLAVIKDENGDFVDSSADWQTVSKCRDEHLRNNRILSPDGVEFISKALIFAPKGIQKIEPGTTIRVMDGDELRAEGKVIAMRKEHFHSRIWL